MFNYPIDRMVKMHGNKAYSPVWMYQYNYKHNHSLAYMDVANPGEVKHKTSLKFQFTKEFRYLFLGFRNNLLIHILKDFSSLFTIHNSQTQNHIFLKRKIYY
jgi:hypothetical protein